MPENISDISITYSQSIDRSQASQILSNFLITNDNIVPSFFLSDDDDAQFPNEMITTVIDPVTLNKLRSLHDSLTPSRKELDKKTTHQHDEDLITKNWQEDEIKLDLMPTITLKNCCTENSIYLNDSNKAMDDFDTKHDIKATSNKTETIKTDRNKISDHKKNSKKQITNNRKIKKDRNTIYEELWQKQYEKLKEFYEKYGHSNVPRYSTEYPKLAAWVHNQRMQYNRKRPCLLTESRMESLRKVDFQWSGISNLRQTWDQLWLERYNQLSEFKKKFGHFYVIDDLYPDLSKWIRKQRQVYKNLKNSPRYQALDKLGFEWRSESPKARKEKVQNDKAKSNLPKKRGPQQSTVPRKIRKEDERRKPEISKTHNTQSVEKEKEDGSTPKIPHEPRKNTGATRSKARKEKEEKKAGNEPKRSIILQKRMNEEPKQPLNDESKEIVYERNPRQKHLETLWREKCNELQIFKKEYGHCKVPSPYSLNPSLAIWLKNQRLLNKQKKLLDHRVAALEEIGPEWKEMKKNFSEIVWEQSYNEFARFRKMNGHLHVPKKSVLRDWVKDQKKLRIQYNKEKPCALSAHCIKALEQIGFEFTQEGEDDDSDSDSDDSNNDDKGGKEELEKEIASDNSATTQKNAICHDNETSVKPSEAKNINLSNHEEKNAKSAQMEHDNECDDSNNDDKGGKEELEKDIASDYSATTQKNSIFHENETLVKPSETKNINLSNHEEKNAKSAQMEHSKLSVEINEHTVSEEVKEYSNQNNDDSWNGLSSKLTSQQIEADETVDEQQRVSKIDQNNIHEVQPNPLNNLDRQHPYNGYMNVSPYTGQNWHVMYQELVAFSHANGHCEVLYNHNVNTLGNWLREQRVQYRKLLINEESTMTREQLHLLEAVGMSWTSLSWNKMLDLISQSTYQDIPAADDSTKATQQWHCKRQMEYDMYCMYNRLDVLTPEQVETLEYSGFKSTLADLDYRWIQKCEELKAFVYEHGHHRVPRHYMRNLSLGHWLYNQKVQYGRLRKGGGYTSMSPLRIKTLKSIGCDWKIFDYDSWRWRVHKRRRPARSRPQPLHYPVYDTSPASAPNQESVEQYVADEEVVIVAV